MSWRTAKALDKLLAQLNALYPNRSKAADGSIGDAAHASRKSDHNPWIRDSKGTGVVTARDFTHDPDNGIDGNLLCRALVESKDPRIKYVIWNRKIYNVKKNFAPEPYKGINAHSHHVHLSVSADPARYDDLSAWSLVFEVTAQEIQERATPVIDIREGAKGLVVFAIQNRLKDSRLLGVEDIDGIFGPKTTAAVRNFQAKNKLRADGIVGPNTAALLGVKQENL